MEIKLREHVLLLSKRIYSFELDNFNMYVLTYILLFKSGQKRLTSINSVDTSCMVKQIVSLYIVQNSGKFCGEL